MTVRIYRRWVSFQLGRMTLANRPDLLAITLFWAPLFAWRPWYIGFYHDDWILLRRLSLDEIGSAYSSMPSRPLLATINVASALIVGPNPIAWQIIMAGCALGVAFMFASITSDLCTWLTSDRKLARWGGAFAAAIWLSAPFNLGFMAFATTFNGMVGLILFFASCRYVLKPQPSRQDVIAASIFNLLLGLIFEALWGAVILIAAARLLRDLMSGSTKRFTFLMPLALTAIQFILVLYNRIWQLIDLGQNKPFSMNAIAIFEDSVVRLAVGFLSTVRSSPTLAVALMLIVAIALKALLTAPKSTIQNAVLLLATCTLGGAASTLIYAFGGYVIETSGLNSRTTFGLSIWISIGCAALVVAAVGKKRYERSLVVVTCLTVLGNLALMQFSSLQSWISTWNFEKSVLENFPVHSFVSQVRVGTMIAIEAEAPQNSVYGFNAFWDISGALYSSFPEVRAVYQTPFWRTPEPGGWIAVVVNSPRWQSSWDGRVLEQNWCSGAGRIWSLPAPGGLLFWRIGDANVTQVKGPQKFGCGVDRPNTK